MSPTLEEKSTKIDDVTEHNDAHGFHRHGEEGIGVDPGYSLKSKFGNLQATMRCVRVAVSTGDFLTLS